MLRAVSAVFVVAGALVVAGCETAESTEPATTQAATTQASMGMINDSCPMTGEALGAGAKTVEYHGHTIGFCCDGCVGPWEAKSDAEKSAYVSKFTK